MTPELQRLLEQNAEDWTPVKNSQAKKNLLDLITKNQHNKTWQKFQATKSTNRGRKSIGTRLVRTVDKLLNLTVLVLLILALIAVL